jgi:hypothetical protein
LRAPTAPLKTLASTLRDHFEAKPVETPEKCRAKGVNSKKRVRFGNDIDDGRRVQTPKLGSTGSTNAHSFVTLDLKTTESVCCHVSQVYSSTSSCQDGCVGYLDISKATPATRLIFYDASKLATKTTGPLSTPQEATSIQGLMQRLQILQQIVLAHKLAGAVLQYHSTSWLPDAWTLQDVACFTSEAGADKSDLSDALNSLHLSNRFPEHGSLGVGTTQESLDLKHTYGIRNLPVAKLGVALLEICARRNMIGSSSNPGPYEIIEARKLLDEKHHSIMTLGNNYLEVVRKCLYCDFSCDDDLNSEALQSAVYTEVVCTLQKMKTRWEKFFGI